MMGTTVQDFAGQYTLEQLARRVGMSPRNIRAHQTRRILHPPVRAGRGSYYDDSHLRRLQNIRSLQMQGFNLVAIEAIFTGTGAGSPDDGARDGVGRLLRRLTLDQPRLAEALSRHGVVRRAPDGSLQPAQSRILRSVIDLHRAGVPVTLSLQVLVEALDRLRPMTDRPDGADARISAQPRDTAPAARPPGDPSLHLHGVSDLLTEAFRMTLHNRHVTRP